MDYKTIDLYAPQAKSVELCLYDDGFTMKRDQIHMTRSKDYFTLPFQKEYYGRYYTFLIDGMYEIVDPYTQATNLNGQRGYFFSKEEIAPFPGNYIKRPYRPIVYELHTVDYTVHPSSNSHYPGTFLGLSEKNTSYKNISTGLDHLVNLGVDYVHLMPVQDFYTVREDLVDIPLEDNYNWGYDPDHYFAIENSYGTDPSDPLSSIRGLRHLIDTLHSYNIGVVLDVVYNHLYLGTRSELHLLDPTTIRKYPDGNPSNGSGVGSDLKTEHPYVRQLILDNIRYLMEFFGIDGLRFDLLGLLDKKTIAEIEALVYSINPEALLYGEPWRAGNTAIEPELLFDPAETEILLFDEGLRDGIRGDNSGTYPGFANGNSKSYRQVCHGLKGHYKVQGVEKGPKEVMTYIHSHDDYILMDHLDKLLPNATEEEKLEIQKLELGILSLSPAPIMIHAGDEFGRRRYKRNPYNGPLSNVAIDWNIAYKNRENMNYIKEIFKLRKRLPVASDLEVLKSPEFTMALASEKEGMVYFINASEAPVFVRETENFPKDLICIFDEYGPGKRKVDYKREAVNRKSISIYFTRETFDSLSI